MLKTGTNQTTQLIKTMTTTDLATKIASLKPGYMHGTNIPGKRGGVYVRPKNGVYECETCWIVPEAHADAALAALAPWRARTIGRLVPRAGGEPTRFVGDAA